MKRGGTSCALFVFVFLMVAALPIWSQKVINLTTDGADVYIHRDSTSEQFGFSAATGDFNKDGYMDIAIGSITATPPSGPSQAGKVYVFYGDGSWPADINLDTTSADLEIQGAGYGEWLGFAVEFADLNKDGYDDIIIGGPGWYGSGDPGNVYIIFGRVEPLFGVINARGDQSLRITSKKRLGFALACGDVNKNGYTDLVISAPGPEAPERFVFDGSTLTGITVPYTIDLSTQSADIKIINYSPAASTANGSGCSKELACGDVNGDGYADILLGAPIADPEGRSDAGKVYAIFGSSNPPGIIDLSIAFADVTIYGAYAGEMFGNALASGDVNNDGYNDIIVGEWPEDQAVHVFFGSGSIPSVIDLNSASADITVLGDGTPCMFGARLATGDINSDCYEDLVI